jgi:protein gp37
MAEKTKIQWTESTWNPIRARNQASGKIGWHCEHVTAGCEGCYSEAMNLWVGTGLPFKPGHRKDIELFLDEAMLAQPLRWKRPRMIFVCSMTDLFAEFVSDPWIDRMFAVMEACRRHTFQCLTKRPERMSAYCRDRQPEPPPNVWLGISAEDQPCFDQRWPLLRETPALRFISYEPALGPVRLPDKGVLPDWVIFGGESGRPLYRQMDPQWARDMRDD